MYEKTRFSKSYGFAMVEYLIALGLFALIFLVSWGLDKPPVEQIIEAAQRLYIRFSFALSLPW